VPTYQYVCTECQEPLEAVQGFNDERLTVCPACGGRLRQVFSAVGVVFKGSGFYRTDSRGKPAAASGSAESSSSGDSAPAPASAGDSAPAAPPTPSKAAPVAASGGDGGKVA
jgi:putative FmdB family regulatory protein